MGNIPAPHLTLISGLNALEAEVINDFTGSYGDNTVAFEAALERVLSGLAAAGLKTTEALVGNGASVWEADDEVITEASHGLAVGDKLRIAITSGATGATAGTHYVKTVPTANTFTVATTVGGATVAVSADGVVEVYRVYTAA